MTDTRLKPKKAMPQVGALRAWWYEDEKGIEVYIQPNQGAVVAARIPWPVLIRATKRWGDTETAQRER